jgi:hypothetical protein
MLAKRLGVQATHLATEPLRKMSQVMRLDEKRVTDCQDALTNFIETSGYTYEKRDLIALCSNAGFRLAEIEEALLRMTKSGALQYSPIADGYSKP